MNPEELNWDKVDGLVPAIVQDSESGAVLMLGYMSRESLELTLKTGNVVFFSRSRQSLWTKGETSGNFLAVVDIRPDCDRDALLIRARPSGPTCHLGTPSCFGAAAAGDQFAFLAELESIIAERFSAASPESSYVARLASKGIDRMAQKVGEEAVETAIASKNPDLAAFESEASDLLFHLLVLLKARGSSLGRLVEALKQRHSARS